MKPEDYINAYEDGYNHAVSKALQWMCINILKFHSVPTVIENFKKYMEE